MPPVGLPLITVRCSFEYAGNRPYAGKRDADADCTQQAGGDACAGRNGIDTRRAPSAWRRVRA
eukprot:4363311-Pleurochrysis_carterae.AAC.1